MSGLETLDVGQANELKLAFRRNGWTNEDVKKMSEGDLLAKLLPVVRGRAEVVIKSILILIRIVKIAAQPAITTSKEYFREAGVGLMDNEFEDQFLGLEVPETGEAEFSIHNLEEASVDGSIINQLGGEKKAEISVSQFKVFLANNRGSLELFLFYSRGRNGKLCPVRASWNEIRHYWYVGARSVERQEGGRRVLSLK